MIPMIGLDSISTDWFDLEAESYWNMRLWHVIFIFLSGFCSVGMLPVLKFGFDCVLKRVVIIKDSDHSQHLLILINQHHVLVLRKF